MLPVTRNIAIVSHEGDLHALMVCDELRRAGHRCAFIASDTLAGTPGLSWYLDRAEGPALCHDIDGHEITVSNLHLVWWRRMPRGASHDYRGRFPNAVQIFSANNIRDSLLGIFLNDFRGVWLDHPELIQGANNKLTQLRAASALGLRVPRTLLSQNPDRIRQFAAALDGPMIVKTVAGMLGIPSLTGLVTPERLEQDGPLKACPALYQEFIPGRKHLRVHCFGSEVHAALIESDLLDWRHPLDADITPYALPQEIRRSFSTCSRASVCKWVSSTSSSPTTMRRSGLNSTHRASFFLFKLSEAATSLAHSFASFNLQSKAITRWRSRFNQALYQISSQSTCA